MIVWVRVVLNLTAAGEYFEKLNRSHFQSQVGREWLSIIDVMIGQLIAQLTKIMSLTVHD